MIWSCADLSSGSLHVSAVSGTAPSKDSYNAGAEARFQDILHITGVIVAPVVVLFTERIDGRLVSSTLQNYGAHTAELVASLTLQSAAVGPGPNYTPFDRQTIWQVQTSLIDMGTCTAPQTVTIGTYHSYNECRSGAGDYDITYTLPLTVTDAARDIMVNATMNAGSRYGGQSLFGDTGAFALTLPDGLSFTSDSGAFTSSPEAFAVPEPSTAALLLGPLAVLWCGRRARYPKAPTSCVTAVAISRTRANMARIGTITSACSRA